MAILRNKLKALIEKSRTFSLKRENFVNANNIQNNHLKIDFTKAMFKFAKNAAIGTTIGTVSGSLNSLLKENYAKKGNDYPLDERFTVFDSFFGGVIGGWGGAAATFPKTILPVTGLFLYKIFNEPPKHFFRYPIKTAWRTTVEPDGKKKTVRDDSILENSEYTRRLKN